MRKCIVCRTAVAKEDEQDHLASSHLGPHYFWLDAKKFRTMEPSMLVMDLKKMADCSSSYFLFEERSEGGDVPYSDGVAVDLTRGSHFYTCPPATMFG